MCDDIHQQKRFNPGGMALSGSTRSIRAMRDIPLAAYSAPGVITTRCVPYRPQISVWLFLLVVSASYYTWTLWQWSQLWPNIRMGSMGTHLHRDFNTIGDAEKTSPHNPSTRAPNAILALDVIHIIPCRQIHVAIDNPSFIPSISCLTTSSYLCNYVRAADNISHAVSLQSNGCQCVSHWHKFRDRSQVTRVFRYCDQCQS